jgi:hypothetical protein
MRLPHYFSNAIRNVAVGLITLGAFCFVGCGDGKVRRYPVNGVVSIDGKPTQGVMVLFFPQGGSEEFQRIRPMGITVADGKFALNTFGNNDGVPAGQYKVLFTWPAQSKGPSRDGTIQMGPDQFKGKHNNPETAPTVEVKSGTNDLPPFDLKK